MIGVVNDIFRSLERKHPDVAKLWAKNQHIEKDLLFNGSFNGNSCRKLLKSTNFLRSYVDDINNSYLLTLESLNNIVATCFGCHYDKEDSAVAVRDFRTNFQTLCEFDKNLHVTPKVHVILHHVKEFCDKNNCGLGLFSEQARQSTLISKQFGADTKFHQLIHSAHQNY